jgi:hypothetical protein
MDPNWARPSAGRSGVVKAVVVVAALVVLAAGAWLGGLISP